jgi:hypothetical protein
VGPLRVEDEAVQVQLRREVIELENSTELLRFRGTQDARLQRYSELELHHRPSAVLLDHLPLRVILICRPGLSGHWDDARFVPEVDEDELTVLSCSISI